MYKKLKMSTFSNITPNWCLPSTNNAVWNNVKEYTKNEVGYGTKPPNTGLDSCVDPRTGIVLL